MVWNVSKCVLYIILLLSVLSLFLADHPEKNNVSLINSMSIETGNSGHGTAETVSIPVTNSINKPSNIFVMGVGKKTLLKTISPEEAKNQCFADYGMDGSVSSRDFNTPETLTFSEPPSYTIQNIVIGVTFRGFHTSGILAAGDIIHYQINVTNNINCSLTNVTLTDPVVKSMKPEKSISEDGIMDPYETWTYTGSYIVSQNDININGNGSGTIENMATIDCDQFDPISSTATVPIIVLPALTVNETFANVSLRGNDNVKKPGGPLTYKADVTNTGKIRLANLLVDSPPIAIFTKDGKLSFGVLSPGKSWTSKGIYNATLDNLSNNGGGKIVSSAGAAYDQVSPRSSRVNTLKYRILQPVSPPRKYLSSNTSYLCESSNFVGADGHTITLVNNESAVDPNYKQLVEFIKEDKTNEITYNNTSFVCSDTAERVHNNAEAIGFRSAWVYIDFANESATLNPATNALVVGHACNLFNTTDKGLIAIDCTGGSCPSDAAASIDLSKWDNEVFLVKNGEYTPRLLYSFPGSDKLNEFLSMGTIADFYIFW
jgi:uncharacterized repeat protein (TIGR01451 family)